MTLFSFFVLTFVGLLALWLLGSYFVVLNVKEPKYKVILQEKGYEIRHYHPFLIAEIDIFGNRSRAMSDGYRILSYYLFGGNEGEVKMDFMHPVRDVRKNTAQHTIQFMLPKTYSLKTIPKPEDTRIGLKQIKLKNIAVMKYTGLANQKIIDKRISEFKKMLSKDNYSPLHEFISAEYNPPFSFPLMKRNEIMVEIE